VVDDQVESHGFAMPAYGLDTVYALLEPIPLLNSFEEFAAVYELLTSRIIIVTPLDGDGQPISQYADDFLGYSSAKRIARVSQISGNNGSATNSDDVTWSEVVVYALGASFVLVVGYLIGNLPERHRAYRGSVYTPHGRYDFDFFQRADRPSSLHEVPSQINGNNGEYTGSDDLDRLNAARRLNQQARNHRHRRPVPNGRAEEDDIEERQPGRARARPVGDPQQVAEVVVEVVIPIVTLYREHG